jgi:hypothetical protein
VATYQYNPHGSGDGAVPGTQGDQVARLTPAQRKEYHAAVRAGNRHGAALNKARKS